MGKNALDEYKNDIIELLSKYPSPEFDGTITAMSEKFDVLQKFIEKEKDAINRAGKKAVNSDQNLNGNELQSEMMTVVKNHFNLN